MVEDNKRKCTENDLPNNKKMCLSPSVTQDDNLTALLPSMVQDSPAVPVPSSSCDPSVMPPQSISCDAPVKVHRPSPHERQTTPPLLKDFPSSHDLPIIPPGSHDVSTKPLQPSVLKPIAHPILHDSSSPSSHDLPTTPPGSQDISNMPNPVNPTAHDSAATPPNLHDASVKSHSSSRDVDEHNTSLPNDCDTSLLSTSPPLLSTKEQLEFSDPAVDIINTQLNQQITEVQHFLKTDRLKRTKLPDTNNVQ